MDIFRLVASLVMLISGFIAGTVSGEINIGAQPEEVFTTTTTVPPPPWEPRLLAYPKEEFWDELARCETASNWQDEGRFGGGLGIMNVGTFAKGVLGQGQMGTWERWGGEEFAPSPQQATKEQQIIVANRIAVEGWSTVVDRGQEFAERKGVPRIYHYDKDPVGFYGWGALDCAGGKPPLFFYENTDPILTMDFSVPRDPRIVHDLQGLLGVKQDGQYGKATRKAHKKWLSYIGLPPTMLGQVN